MDKVGLSLDDIIKINKKTKQGAKRGGKRGRGSVSRGGSGRGKAIMKKISASRGGKFSRGAGRGRGKASSRGGFQQNNKSVINGGVQQRRSTRIKTTRGGQNLKLASRQNKTPNKKSKPGKLMINNLDFKVTDQDMEELFSKHGVLLKAAVHYDSQGKSLGAAEVLFQRQESCIKAMNEYNNVLLDGRPMKISLIGPQNELISIDSRLGPKVNNSSSAPKKSNNQQGAGAARGRGRGRGASRGRGSGSGNAATRGRGGNRGRGATQGRRRGRPTNKPISAETLDQQLDEYIQQAGH